MTELKLKYTVDDIDKLHKELGNALDEAREDYVRKKKAKGEEIDETKLRNAINQRKKLRILCKRLMAAHFNVGNILDHSAVNRASEQLEREASALESLSSAHKEKGEK